MLRIGLPRWLNLLGASPVAIYLGLSLLLLSPAVSAQTAEQLEKQYGREAMQKALETKHLYDLYGIHFDIDQATIRPETQPLFDDIAQMLKNFPMWRLSIVGHTDSTGDAAQNQLLSLQRANAVKLALVDRGIQASRLETEGAGQNQPVASNNTPEGRALNRRVALIRLDSINGQVIGAGAPIAGSTVTLWAAGAGAPTPLGQAQTGADGRFVLNATAAAGDEAILYLVAKGGQPTASTTSGDNPAIALLAVLGATPPAHVVINELTTVASAFTAARFISGESISGNPLGLRIAAMNVPNLVNLQSGGWGAVIVDGLNLTRSTTLSNFNTLASLVTYASTSASDDWRSRFFQAATPSGGTTPSNTLSAMAGIARQPWAHPKDLFALFEEAYPQTKEGLLNAAPFAPYLQFTPTDFALILRFSGGGIYAAGRGMFDVNSNYWSGGNWMPGSQSTVVKNIGGGVAKFGPDGSVLSPPVTGFTGAGINGVGWGTAVTREHVWISSFNGKILVMDLQGRPVASEQDFPFREKLHGLMGVGVAANGDVWIADSEGNQLLFFPGGRVKEGRIVKVAGLAGPFDIVIDEQSRVWVSNSRSDTVVRFPANDPTQVETYRVGLTPRALALDSKNNVWAASFLSPDFPGLKPLPPNATIMQEFQAFSTVVAGLQSGRVKATGFVSMIRPDGSQPTPSGYTGDGAVNVPWGINVDGNDDVWTTNGWNLGVVYMAGDNTKGHPAGTKTGDLLHLFTSGAIETVIDVSIDAAGNAWGTNNWNDLPIATGMTENPKRSTWGGGTGIIVIYGVAEPVQPPRMGKVRTY